ncbi:uncharacterized protein LOC115408446 isoform X3 [Salarias fasciatus]|uniref:uncharacterized protein LOC115408446 isoform X3 n=1 Tax=Salarias fasciatus TaxID=181472 RepID=UPI0011764FE4|nr:uncharacterized protein LOC115408446 isoform X3 [Salarias fasciatus]
MAGGGSRWRVLQQLLVPVLVLVRLSSSSSDLDSERGELQLRRMRDLAAQPRYGGCWARALQDLDARCRQLTAEEQSRLALRFTHCHLSSSGRDFPSCPEGSEVSSCTRGMDAIAFHSYTEFFTHAHSICRFLQAEAWQSRAEGAVHRLTESSAAVAEQLDSARQMAEELFSAQSAALQAQQDLLSSGEELRASLTDSTEGKAASALRPPAPGGLNSGRSLPGLRSVFSELSSSSRAQRVVLTELFHRVSFLHSFLLTEAHSLSSCCYNAAAFCAAFLLTSTRRSSRARLWLLLLVVLNFYLEKKIYQFLRSRDAPENLQLETFSVSVSVLRRVMVSVGLLVLLLVCVRYRDPVQQSLQVLQQLQETQRSLQEALQQAESLGEQKKKQEEEVERRKRRRREEEEEEEEQCSVSTCPSDVSLSGWRDHSLLSSTVNDSDAGSALSDSTLTGVSHNATVRRRSPARGSRRSGPSRSSARSSARSPARSSARSSPLVYSVLVEDKQPRYSLRNRRSDAR